MINRKNLLRLAKYLESNKLKAKFNMEHFADSEHDYSGSTDCGTAGCAVGHAPFAGLPKEYGEKWEDYSERVFGLRWDSPLWRFLFGGCWSTNQETNTPAQAAARIRFVLRNGKEPTEWDYNCIYREELDEVFRLICNGNREYTTRR